MTPRRRFSGRLALLVVCCMAVGLTAVGQVAPTAQTAARPQPPRVGGGTAVISGVISDATSGRPIAGAVVSLLPLAGNFAGPGLRQVTDIAGRFAFTRLSGGDGYQINASAFGYLDGGFGRATPDAATRNIVLQDGQWFQDARITLWHPAAINGVVRDETGEPVVGAFVTVLNRILVAGQPRLATGAPTRTDDRGMYRISGLRPGTYIVVVPSVQVAVPAATSLYALSGTTPEIVAQRETTRVPVVLRRDPAIPLDAANRLLLGPYPSPPPVSANGRPQAYPITFYPGARTVAGATPLDLHYGDDRQGVDLRILPVPTVRVSGRVDGPPQEFTSVTARLMPSGSEMLGTGNEAATALVASNGTFTFLNVPAGSYTVLVSRSVSEYTSGQLAGFSLFPIPPGEGRSGGGGGTVAFSAPTGTNFTSRIGLGGAAYSGRTRIDVGDSNLANVAVTMQRAATLSGRVVVEQSASAAPARGGGGPGIWTEPADGDPTLGQPRGMIQQNDPEMHFTIEGLRAGEYLLRLPGLAAIKSIMWDGKDYANTPFDTSSGQDISGVVLTTTDQVATMTGMVRDASGAPRTNAAVIYFPQEREQWTKFGLQPPRLRSVPATSAGTYTVGRAPAGDYFLVAVDEAAADGWKDPKFLEAAAQLATRVSVNWGETKTQNLIVQQIVLR